MKFLCTLGLLIGIQSVSAAQFKRYDIAPFYGFYKAPDFSRINHRDAVGIDFTYHFSDRWMITSGFTSGRFSYLEEVRTFLGPPPFEEGPRATNADGTESHAYALLTYSLLKKGNFVLTGGLGLGIFTRTLAYPYAGPSSVTSAEIFTVEQSFRKLEIPVNVSVTYDIVKSFGIGLKTGAFFIPSYGLIGFHVGPRMYVRL